MDTVQDKSEAPIGKAQDTDGDAKSIHENLIESNRKNERVYESVAKPTTVKSRTTNLLEKAYDDWLANAAELDRLQTLTHKAHKKNQKLQTLIQKTHRVRYAAMKREHESALKEVQARYIAYDTTRDKVRRKENESERVNKAHRTVAQRYLVSRDSIVVISSDSEDDSKDSDWDTMSDSTDSTDSTSGEDNLETDTVAKTVTLQSE